MTVDRDTLIQTGVTTSAAASRMPIRRWRCKVTSGPEAGRQLDIGANGIMLGAAAESDLTLSDPAVSARHLEITLVAEGARVRDLGSTNGTFLHGNRIDTITIAQDATLKVGEIVIRITSAQVPAIPPSRRRSFGGLVGDSLPMRELFAVLELVAPTRSTVLVQGESGTGKELVAGALHDHSPRAAEPFVIVDCSALSAGLLDSQLFGHKRGAFTGADTDRAGAFAEANGGTLFIDEIGELPLESQGRLLRALEDGTVQPLGSDVRVPADVRVVAATHRDLYGMVTQGTFRFDLFHRLAVVNVYIPPLRERPEDIARLVHAFYEGRGADAGAIEGDNAKTLLAHSWPGNVRELRNVLERAWVFSGGENVAFADLRLWLDYHDPRQLDLEVDIAIPLKEARRRWLDTLERKYLAAAFQAHGENLSHTAAAIGINRRHLRTALLKYGLLEK